MQPEYRNSTALSKLFVYNAPDARDEFEERLDRAHFNLQQQINGLSDADMHDTLLNVVCNEKQHEEISLAFMYIILTDPAIAPKAYRDITLASRDGMNVIVNSLTHIVVEKYSKLTDVAHRQLIWLVREFVKHQVLNIENIIWNCLRQASGGDVSAKNLFLVESLLDIFIDYRPWLETNVFLVQSVIYSYVRLLEDHANPGLVPLRQKETSFIISLIRERFLDVIPLGRDFVRLLQNVARIPEFEQLWKDILYNPRNLHPTFTGIWQLFQMRTSRRFLQCRLVPEVERRLHFLTSTVKFGNQKRYQDWFQEKYFLTPESQSLRSDMIRFIINVIHPTNDMLCSDIIPRWAIIGWLISSCTNPIASANAKLSLFYDWLFFDPQKDNIMNIEPGILVMYHSLRTHPFVTNSLLDFLCRTVKNFFLRHEDKIRAGVHNSLKKILEKQVVPNLLPLFDSPKLDRDLRLVVREMFKEFISPVTTGGIVSHIFPTHPAQPIAAKKDIESRPGHHIAHHSPVSSYELQPSHQYQNIVEQDDSVETLLPSGCSPPTPTDFETHPVDNIERETDAVFSDDDVEDDHKECKFADLTDDDDDLPLSKVRLKERCSPDKIELPDIITESFEAFKAKKNTTTFEAFLEEFRKLTASSLDEAQLQFIISTIIYILRDSLSLKGCLPESKADEKKLSVSISYPLFGLFRHLYGNDDKLKKPFQSLLEALCQNIPETGYLFLYFSKVFVKLQSKKNSQQTYPFKSHIYKQICEAYGGKQGTCLVHDMDLLETENTGIFLWLLPDIYKEFKSVAINNIRLIRITLRCLDAKSLRDLMYHIAQGKLTIFKEDGLLECIRESLEYETFEQFCLWHLVQAHDFPASCLQDLLPDLEASHAEALDHMLLLLKKEEPTTELIRLLLSRESKPRGDPFVTSVLRIWCQREEEKLSEIIASLLTSKYPVFSPTKRKRPLKSGPQASSAPTADQILSHLEHYRRSCRHGTGTGLYIYDQMQRALQASYASSSDAIKKQFSDLFALAAEEENIVGRRGSSGRGRKQLSGKKDSNGYTASSKRGAEAIKIIYSSGENSSEEDWSKHKTTQVSKKRKKIVNESD